MPFATALDLIGSHETLADLRGDLGGNHHPVEHFTGLRDPRDGWHALRIRCSREGVNRLASGAAVIAAGESYLRLSATSPRRPCFPRTPSRSEYE